MNSILNNKNLRAVVKNKPLYTPIIFFNILRGIFSRKFGNLSKLKKDQNIEKIIRKIQYSNQIEINESWQDHLYLDLNSIFIKWNLERNVILESLFINFISDSQSYDLSPDDKENSWSAVQLNWLFFNVRRNKTNKKEAEEIIESCCKFMNNHKSDWIYRPFTLSEIITNIIKIKLFFGKSLNLSKNVQKSLESYTRYILKNLEIYSVSSKNSLNHTNNHILSNVRALYWASNFFTSKELNQIADYLFYKYCKPLFKDGTLDEGSTVYHLVVAQCIFDISFFVSLKELPRVDKLILKLNENKLIDPHLFPVIGDVSPDPNLGTVIDDAMNISSKLKDIKELAAKNKVNDFEFFNHKNWVCVLHSRNNLKHIQHSHNDYGSPVLTYKSRLILCDLGRPSYSKSKQLNDYTLTSLHSVPQIEGLDQNPRSARDIYPNKFLNPKFRKAREIDEDKSQYTRNNTNYKIILGNQFKLFPNVIFGGCWYRFFISNLSDESELLIEDIVILDKKAEVKFRFYTPDISNFTLPLFEFKLNEKAISPIMTKISCNKYYGQIEAASGFEISSSTSLKHHLVTTIRIKNE